MNNRRKYFLSSNEDDNNLDMTPMLDVVFILLIFFIVSTSFIKASGIEVDAPVAASASRQETGTIIVGISDSQEIWIDGRIVNINAVRPNIERLHAENPEGTVIIQPDIDSSSGTLVAVLDQVRLAGVSNISIAANPVK
jgi:biopolymer transport protein ExbD